MFCAELDTPEYLELLPRGMLQFGGSSGGGQSGAVDYPAYMKTWHNVILQTTYNEVQAANIPPTTYMYDPKVWFGVPLPANSVYKTLAKFAALDTSALFKDLLSSNSTVGYILGETAVGEIKARAEDLRALLVDPTGADATCEAMIDSHSAKLLQKINTDVMPKVEVGMRDLNAVVGTSFVIARELVMEDYMHEVADFSGKARTHLWELRHDLYKFVEGLWAQAAVHAAEIGMKRVAMSMEKLKTELTASAELANIAVLAQSKYGVVQTEKETRTKTWRLDMWNHMNAALASISGAHTVTPGNTQGSSMFGSALGMGAMGAGVGAYLGAGSTFGGLATGSVMSSMGSMMTVPGTLGMAGGPLGAIIGGALGIGAGLLSSLFKK
jgi:hypothetical protein